MTKRNDQNIAFLTKSYIRVLDKNRREILSLPSPEERVSAYVRGAVPLYPGALIQYVVENPGLPVIDYAWDLPNCPDIYQIIQLALRRRLQAEGDRWLEFERNKED